ncbi:ATP-binding protein [Streptomyces sp. NPDC020472]|uniref:ATP-binding protein n=1 Tax=Streptomyces sp. NPDC020472 TaxID=3365075 RepID=UPI0037A23780
MSTTVIRPAATGEPGYSSKFACCPESVPEARGLVRSALQTWGMERLAPEALVAVSELATNAVIHSGGSEIEVRVCRTKPGRVRVEVADSSNAAPRLADPQPNAESGRGLMLVNALADQWGTENSEAGKRVWAEFSSAVRIE